MILLAELMVRERQRDLLRAVGEAGRRPRRRRAPARRLGRVRTPADERPHRGPPTYPQTWKP